MTRRLALVGRVVQSIDFADAFMKTIVRQVDDNVDDRDFQSALMDHYVRSVRPIADPNPRDCRDLTTEGEGRLLGSMPDSTPSPMAGGAHTPDAGAIAVYGLHRGLILFDGFGRGEFASAHDPIPALAHRIVGARPISGDPFDDPARPLVLTVASDCAELPDRVYRDLLSLSRYPGVEVSLAPGLDDLGYEEVLRFGWKEDTKRIEVTQSASDARRSNESFAAFDSPASTSVRKPRNHASTRPDPGLEAAASRMFDAPGEAAGRLVKEAIAHKALGNDYIVSSVLVRARRVREAGWPNQLGACTAAEAFALAGLKSRMYRVVPLVAEPHGLESATVGTYRDLAVLRLTPRLWRALGAALGPSATTDEAACWERLIAIRSRMNDLLIARDEVLRLARRDALGPSWARPFDRGPVSGAGGNDVVSLLAYHSMAALNALNAVADNLAWIVRRRSGLELKGGDTSSGFARLVSGRKQARSTERLEVLARRLAAYPGTGLVLGLLRLRNAFAHREGVDFGHVSLEPPSLAQVNEVIGLWFGPDSVGPTAQIGGSPVDLFDACRHHATFSAAEVAIFTFPTFIDLITCASFALTNVGLSTMEWSSSRTWLFESGSYRNSLITRHQWRSDLHRRLFALSRNKMR